MKKIITLVLAMAASSVFCTAVMAADETISGFYDIGTATDVVITPYAGETAVEMAEKNIDSDDAMENVYADSNRLDVTYGGAVANEHYGIILVEGSELPTKDTEVYYINQETAASASVAFSVYPKLPSETKDMTLYISSSAEDADLVSVPVNYAVNAAVAPEECEHSYDAGVETLAPTCAEDGVKTYTCTLCGNSYTEVIPATGEHSWNEGVVTLEPTVDAEGVKTYTCSVCGETKTEAIEKLPAATHTPGNVNGDTEVDVKDVIAIRQHIAGGYDVEILEVAANVNGDAVIDVKDVIAIRQFIAGGYDVELQ